MVLIAFYTKWLEVLRSHKKQHGTLKKIILYFMNIFNIFTLQMKPTYPL